MAARRCSTCSIDYPSEYHDCKACGGKTSWFSSLEPDPDWEYAVAMKSPDISVIEDGLINWRYGCLMRAGADPRLAVELSTRRDVDLHQAVYVVEGAGSAMARRIFL